jgi:mRNA-degrading endonuclease RelE of RelBE toxin-antitoxin system
LERQLEFTDDAIQTLASMKKADRRFVLDGVRTHLIENDPAAITRNKFPLRRPSEHAERELRLDHWRVFYSVVDGELVIVNLIGEKRGNRLFIGGEEFEL